MTKITMGRRKRSRRKTGAGTHTCNRDEEEEEEEEQQSGISILSLPSAIQVDILSRLPLESIFHCQCVCRNWHDLLSDPLFAYFYLKRPPFTNVVVSIYGTICLLELKGAHDYIRRAIRPLRFNSKFNLPNKYNLLGSCNGLLCLSDQHVGGSLYVSNPILGEYVSLPKPRKERKNLEKVYGFGFSPATKEYKVLKIMGKRVHDHPSSDSFDYRSQGEIFTLGTDSWRNIGDVPFPFCGKLGRIALNGALHWIVDDCASSELIYSFDIGEEQLRPVPPPSDFGNRSIWKSLGVLGNSLSIFDLSRPNQVDIWSMKEYGVAESWTRNRIVTCRTTVFGKYLFQPITLLKDGEILMLHLPKGPLVSCFPKGEYFRYITAFGGVCEVFP